LTTRTRSSLSTHVDNLVGTILWADSHLDHLYTLSLSTKEPILAAWRIAADASNVRLYHGNNHLKSITSLQATCFSLTLTWSGAETLITEYAHDLERDASWRVALSKTEVSTVEKSRSVVGSALMRHYRALATTKLFYSEHIYSDKPPCAI
jgi:hypothetical protein